MPASTKRCPVIPPRQATAYSSTATAAPPPNAASDTGAPLSPAPSSAATAPALAPWEMPMTSGLASGLPSTDWNSAPERPKARPTSTASASRGRRRVLTTKSAGPGSVLNSARSTSGTE